jgi:hypothetical protein
MHPFFSVPRFSLFHIDIIIVANSKLIFQHLLLEYLAFAYFLF